MKSPKGRTIIFALIIIVLDLGVLLGPLTYSYVHASSYVTSFSEKSFRNDHISVEIGDAEDRIFTRLGELVALHNIGVQVYDDSEGGWVELPWIEPPKVVNVFDGGTEHFVVKRGIAGSLVDVSIIYMASRASYRSEPLKIAVVVRGLREENTNVRIVWRFKLKPLLVHKLRLFSPTLQNLATLINKEINTYRDITFEKNIPGLAGDLIDKIENSKLFISPRKARAFPAMQLFDRSEKLLIGFNYQDIALDLKQFTIDLKTKTIELVFGDYVVNKYRTITVDPYLDGGGGGSYATYPVSDTAYIYGFEGTPVAVVGVSARGPPLKVEAVASWGSIEPMMIGCGVGFVGRKYVVDLYSISTEVGWAMLYDVVTGSLYYYGDLNKIIHFLLVDDAFQATSSEDYLYPLGSVILNIVTGAANALGVPLIIPDPFTFISVGNKWYGKDRDWDKLVRTYSGSCWTSSLGRNICAGINTRGGGQLYHLTINYPEKWAPGHDAYIKMYFRATVCVLRRLADYFYDCGSKTIYWWVYLKYTKYT